MLEKLSEKAGVKIVVHDPSQPPMPDEFGIDLQPNTGSSVAVQTVLIVFELFYFDTWYFGEQLSIT